MLPPFYPDDFDHAGLDWRWFRDDPWTTQDRVMRVERKMRCIRNPLTSVFVVVLKLNPEDPQQVYPFFGVTRLVGWMPAIETLKGEPVEAVMRLCEGMERSREFVAKHYGETPAQIEAAVKGDERRVERLRDEQMLATSSLARAVRQELMVRTQFTDSNSPVLKEKMFEDAGREYQQARQRLLRSQDRDFSLVTAKP